MKALTVRQPWAWAIVHGGKNVENRNWAPRFPPGRIAIHAGATPDRRAYEFPEIKAALVEHQEQANAFGERPQLAMPLGVVIGTVQLHECHMPDHGLAGRWSPCALNDCATWGQDVLSHWVLTDPRPCDPIPVAGRLNLWTLPDDVASQLGVLT